MSCRVFACVCVHACRVCTCVFIATLYICHLKPFCTRVCYNKLCGKQTASCRVGTSRTCALWFGFLAQHPMFKYAFFSSKFHNTLLGRRNTVYDSAIMCHHFIREATRCFLYSLKGMVLPRWRGAHPSFDMFVLVLLGGHTPLPHSALGGDASVVADRMTND